MDEKERRHIYYVKNKDKIAEAQRKYNIDNNEVITAKKKIWREKNKDYMRNYKKNYYLEHREKIVEKSKLYNKKRYSENKDMIKTKQYVYRRKIRNIVLIHYGGNFPRCKCCGDKHDEFLTLHHENNNGAEERKKMKLYQLYAMLINKNFPKRYAVLCYNCNCSKGFRKYCPHDKERENKLYIA